MRFFFMLSIGFMLFIACEHEWTNPLDPQAKEEAFVLISPEDKALIVSNRPTFSWQAVAQASAYLFEVDDKSDFSSPELSLQITETRYTPSVDLSDGTHYWRVLPLDSTEERGKLTKPQSFIIGDFPNDIDGNVYRMVRIGDQVWMAENLKVTRYRNSDKIPNVTGGSEWRNLSSGAWCTYDNSPSNGATYGCLYNWYAVNDSRGLVPTGWRIPSDADWKQLEMFLGMSQSDADAEGWRGTEEGDKLKEMGTSHWFSPNTSATDAVGFRALPGGYCSYYGIYSNLGRNASFWSSSESSNDSAWYRHLNCNDSDIYRAKPNKRSGFSVRCLRE